MVTHKQIAEQLGIAPRTVSNILSGNSIYAYSQKTRERVLKAAQELNYRPNRSSQAVRRRRSNLIGIIHFASVAEVARKTDSLLPRLINSEGYDYMVIDMNWHGGSVDRVLDELIQARVEGVIISHMTESFGPRYVEMLAKVGIPAVVIYGDDQLNIPLICDDVRSAFFAMTQHLQALGHQRLLLMINTYTARPSRQRQEGFELAVRDFGPCRVFDDMTYFDRSGRASAWEAQPEARVLKVDLSRFGYDPRLGYYETAKRLISQSSLPDAVICFNDIAAISTCMAALEAGLRVPSDLAVTGTDNDLFGEFPLFSLTTIEKDLEGAGTAAVETLIQQIRSKQIIRSSSVRTFPSQLVLRTSCGRQAKPDESSPLYCSIPTIPPEILQTS